MNTGNNDANAPSPFAQATDADISALNALWAQAGVSLGEFLQSAALPARTPAMSAIPPKSAKTPTSGPIEDGAMPDWSWPLQ